MNNDRAHYGNHQNYKPFKRTVEKVLTWIGIVLHALWALLIIGFGSQLPKLLQNKEIQQQLQQQGQDPSQLTEQSQNIIPMLFTVGIPLILALIAAFLFKKRILAGILLIVAALLALFLSASLIVAILWLIAGIMLLVRKPKNHHTDARYAQEPRRNHDEERYRHTNEDHHRVDHDVQRDGRRTNDEDHNHGYRNEERHRYANEDHHRVDHDVQRDGRHTNDVDHNRGYHDVTRTNHTNEHHDTHRQNNGVRENDHDFRDERQNLRNEPRDLKDKGSEAKERFNDFKDDRR
ncbi:hypothetical protein BUY15_05110 [Staphylococcus chromogenes]|uniref:DUF4064 domain-containing protein n=2 Tax=Staphylococcus chromogenes TaxID=46126 RepID=A0AAE5SXV1_STACR|nr:hypothetical protein BUY17_03300 [Staphylococcus chromogenes]PTF49030.1 hypothetical protein BUY13_04855 [Staphylococcus chromogenes]PTF51042.1 hypothetical protein BUY12_08800 [Staphylococcus chromogenes]PTF55409.1 hypothetical protein BUY08_05435 [Staphylococcus chromogenes]PTF59065.1 hypothetical protein BUY07_08440 [Staphylococcus chromogenes]